MSSLAACSTEIWSPGLLPLTFCTVVCDNPPKGTSPVPEVEFWDRGFYVYNKFRKMSFAAETKTLYLFTLTSPSPAL